MSRLSKLIQELCPDGVEYKRLGDIATISRGGSFQKRDYIESGVPCIHYGQIYTIYNLYLDKTVSFISEEKAVKQKKATSGDIIMAVTSENIEDVCKCVAWLGEGEIAVSGHTAIIHHELEPKYLSYYLNSNLFYKQKVKLAHGTKVIEVTPSALDAILLPVPPLEVQREIVRILDSFTLLTAELTAELTARKQQYEFYREQMMNFENVKFQKLGELFPYIRNGFVGTIKPYFTDEEHGVRYLEGTNIHDGIISDNEVLYVTEEFHQKYIRNELKADDLLMVQSGHIGECAVVGEKYKGSNCHALIIMSNGGKCNSRFYMHYFHTAIGFKSLKLAITGGTIKHVLATKVKDVKVPVPDIEVQNYIVDCLDNFDVLCGGIKTSIPAEIEARQKQYEYYRDKLLTFKEKEA
ncbi:restriction endonuclease subunit S [Baileyella intestinalis]|uniref:restriction endonuclease subunit S n=1 Tax=Baileyella intestinalis TaxID=2606709 RepID=UPI00197ED8AA|nr:restriction endonuclease subunit S [Baileyella intestinalis]